MRIQWIVVGIEVVALALISYVDFVLGALVAVVGLMLMLFHILRPKAPLPGSPEAQGNATRQ